MGLRKKKTESSKSTKDAFMGTQQAAVWLGRALSTHDVMIRVTQELMDIVAVQQHMLSAIDHNIGPIQIEGMDISDQSEKILKDLEEIRNKISPILNMVDESCSVLEKMIAS